MKRTNQEKAITLVALIITIIVLLILAVVTIAAITGDGDLISHANNAKTKYMDEAENENTIVQGYISKIPSGDDGQNENVENAVIPEELKKYILGENLQGRSLSEIMNISEMSFLDEPTTIADASTAISLIYILEKEDSIALYILYNSSDYYKFDIYLEDLLTVASTGIKNLGTQITVTSTTEPEIGSTISYDGKTWTVMYKNENNIQMISNDALQYNGNDLYLGCNDAYLIANGTLQGNNDIEKARYSYNNAITTLNAACESIVTKASFVKDVRCVGSNPTNKNSENSTYYKYETLPAFNEIGKDSDNNYLTDYDRLICLGKLKTTNEKNYWLASRYVDIDPDYANMRCS